MATGLNPAGIVQQHKNVHAHRESFKLIAVIKCKSHPMSLF
jgi:hypothetical protein